MAIANPATYLKENVAEMMMPGGPWERIISEIPYLACLKTITQISSTTTIRQQLNFLPDGELYKRRLEAALTRWANEEI